MMSHDATSPYWQWTVALASTVGALVSGFGFYLMPEAITGHIRLFPSPSPQEWAQVCDMVAGVSG